MMHLELTNDEQKILAEILDAELEDLRGEVHSTDRLEYREMLKARERVIKHLIAELRQQEAEEAVVHPT